MIDLDHDEVVVGQEEVLGEVETVEGAIELLEDLGGDTTEEVLRLCRVAQQAQRHNVAVQIGPVAERDVRGGVVELLVEPNVDLLALKVLEQLGATMVGDVGEEGLQRAFEQQAVLCLGVEQDLDDARREQATVLDGHAVELVAFEWIEGDEQGVRRVGEHLDDACEEELAGSLIAGRHLGEGADDEIALAKGVGGMALQLERDFLDLLQHLLWVGEMSEADEDGAELLGGGSPDRVEMEDRVELAQHEGGGHLADERVLYVERVRVEVVEAVDGQLGVDGVGRSVRAVGLHAELQSHDGRLAEPPASGDEPPMEELGPDELRALLAMMGKQAQRGEQRLEEHLHLRNELLPVGGLQLVRGEEARVGTVGRVGDL